MSVRRLFTLPMGEGRSAKRIGEGKFVDAGANVPSPKCASRISALPHGEGNAIVAS